MKKEKIQPTPSQANAIEAPRMDLLVSAAAGSGKTAVLSKRIVRTVIDPDIRADVSRMLIVTFTKAAATELRVRIAREMHEALEEIYEIPEEERSVAQDNTAGLLLDAIDKLEGAEISTIHSFCMNLLKKYGDALGMPTSFRIGEEAECELMRLHAMNDTVESRYESDEEFNYVAETLISLDDSDLVRTLLKIYLTMTEQPEGILFLKKSGDVLRDASVDFWKTEFAAPIKRSLNLFFDYYRKLFDYFFAVLSDDPMWVKAYSDPVAKALSFVKGWNKVKDSDYLTVRSYLRSFESEGLGSYRGEKSPEVQHCYDAYHDFNKAIDDTYLKRYFVFSEEDVSRDALDTAVLTDKLYEVFLEFESRYQSEKKRYGILDFADLERYAHKLLLEEGKPTPLARVIAKRYDAIFIDEYQDTNRRQDDIFSAISDFNRFMVGDIKQSIYRFRGAMPEIFSEYRQSFPLYVKGAGQKQATIFLSNNFRSNRSVVDYSNSVFANLFRNNSGRVPYRDEDALAYSVKPENECHLPTRILAVDTKSELGEGVVLTQFAVIADEIAKLVKSGVSADKIAVLFRSMTRTDLLRKELDKYSLKSVSTSGGDDFFLHPESLLLISLLNVIDNPCRDIYLAAVLKSPLFGLTLGDTVRIRARLKYGSLYGAVTTFAALDPKELSEEEQAVQKKASVFLAFLDKTRHFAERKSGAEIIRYLDTVTPIRAISLKASGNAAAITTLHELARNYEARGFKGLHAFVKYLAELETGKERPALQSAVDLSAVKIMSIHKSKGLEFDYVFLAECEKQATGKDVDKDVLCDKSIGVGMKLRERDGFVRYDSLIRHGVACRLNENSLDEEMRVLYVALTRAKKQLIVCFDVKRTKKLTARNRVELRMQKGVIQHPYLYMSANNYRDWLLMATNHPFDVFEGLEPVDKADDKGGDDSAKKVVVSEETLLSRLRYRYPYESLATLPTKLSVSRLYPGILDEVEEGEELLRSKKADFDQLPAFMQDQAVSTGAERGTATHLFMQFCDFDRLEAMGVDREIERLVSGEYITRPIAELIYRSKLERFLKHPLFARIRAAEELHKEERFNVRFPAEDFAETEERKAELAGEYVLVQGVIDCMLREKDGSLVLIDYKTDHLPREREVAEKLLRERYTTQLTYYKKALELLYGAPVKEVLLYSFSLDDTVTIE